MPVLAFEYQKVFKAISLGFAWFCTLKHHFIINFKRRLERESFEWFLF
jgi:hypothetical protein